MSDFTSTYTLRPKLIHKTGVWALQNIVVWMSNVDY